eukprot:g2938.t1
MAATTKKQAGKQPKTVLDKCVAAILELRSPTGSSRQAIAKLLKSRWGADNAVALRKALQKGVASGKLLQEKASFKVAGAEFEAPKDEQVEMADEVIGTGEEASDGHEVVVSYRGTLDDGSVFDSAKSFRFVLGARDVIKGWDQGIKGMRVGGKRRLVVPSKLGYGKRGSGARGEPGSIPPDATLHFLITLKGVRG